MSTRELLSTHLGGTGIEVGPGHAPFPVPAGVSVRFVDRLTSVQHHDLFPELPVEMGFVEPDIVADLDTDHLRAVESSSQDFVIASHVLEHLADPIAFLDDAHRVLRVGGVLLLLLPDRRCTFDSERDTTPLDCVIRDHEVRATTPDDEHLLEFLLGADQGPQFVLPDDPDERARLFAWHPSVRSTCTAGPKTSSPRSSATAPACSATTGNAVIACRRPRAAWSSVRARSARRSRPRRFARQLDGRRSLVDRAFDQSRR